MDAIKILKDSFNIMHKELLEIDLGTLGGIIIMPIAFLLLFGFVFPSRPRYQICQSELSILTTDREVMRL